MDEPRAAGLREALLHQLRHTIDELAATRHAIGHLSRSESSFTGSSVKELYGKMADWDRVVMLPLMRRMQEEANPGWAGALPEVTRWHQVDFGAVLAAAQAARHALVDFVSGLKAAAWMRTGTLHGETHDMFGLLHALTQHDLRLLQQVAKGLQRSI